MQSVFTARITVAHQNKVCHEPHLPLALPSGPTPAACLQTKLYKVRTQHHNFVCHVEYLKSNVECSNVIP